MQFWTFENRGPKQPQTLMDAIEGVPCIVTLQGQRSMLVKKRKGTLAFAVWTDGEAGNSDFHASNYKFIRYVDPQPAPPSGEVSTFVSAEPFRVFHIYQWNDYYWVDRKGRLYGLNREATSLREQLSPPPGTQITCTNIYATLTEVK